MRARFWLIAAGTVAALAGFGTLVAWAFSNVRSAVAPTPLNTPAPSPAGSAAFGGGDALPQFLVILLIGAGLYYLWRRQKAIYQGVKLAERPARGARYANAIAQLNSVHPDGSPNLEVRRLGISDLEVLAKESPSDDWPVMKALASYIRHSASRERDNPSAALAPRADIQAALSVLAHRPGRYQRGEDERLDLSGSDLRGMWLEGANLAGALLVGADLRGARLAGADLTDAHLERADLRGAYGLT
ncbi:MAG: pentapeptide repeat-containing protein, partial [Armatimonadetes bacterium]|nr:pentapeptide repeat-containing protein [Armatimonadota bacterium]